MKKSKKNIAEKFRLFETYKLILKSNYSNKGKAETRTCPSRPSNGGHGWKRKS